MDGPEKTDRKQVATRWKPGQSGNAKGKPPGTRHKLTMLAEGLVGEKAGEIIATTISKALEGDVQCLRALLDRIIPPRKEVPVRLSLLPISSVSDLPQAMSTVLEAAAAGALTTSEAQSMASLLEAMNRTLATSDLEARIAALESKMGGSK